MHIIIEFDRYMYVANFKDSWSFAKKKKSYENIISLA